MEKVFSAFTSRLHSVPSRELRGREWRVPPQRSDARTVLPGAVRTPRTLRRRRVTPQYPVPRGPRPHTGPEPQAAVGAPGGPVALDAGGEPLGPGAPGPEAPALSSGSAPPAEPGTRGRRAATCSILQPRIPARPGCSSRAARRAWPEFGSRRSARSPGRAGAAEFPGNRPRPRASRLAPGTSRPSASHSACGPAAPPPRAQHPRPPPPSPARGGDSRSPFPPRGP